MRLPGEVHGSNGPLSMSEVPRKVPAVCGVISHNRFGPPTRVVRTPGGIEASSEQALETLPGGESPLDASRGRLLDSQSGDAETSFDVLDDLRDRDGDQEVQPGDDGERLKRLPLEERLAPPDFRELDDPDDEEQRTGLQQADIFVRQGRDDETKGLWQDHVSHRLPPGEPDRPCGLDLARVDGLDSCTKDLALIPSGVRRQRDQTGDERKLVRIQTRETDHEDRANEHDLNEEGRSADRSDVSIAHPTERVLHAEYGGPLRTRLAHRNTSRPRPSDDESDAHPDDVRHGCHVEGNPRAPQIDRPRAGNVRPPKAVRPTRTSRRSPMMPTVRTTAAIVSNVRVRCRRRSSRLPMSHLRILLTNARVLSCFGCSKISCGWPSSRITPPSMKTIRLATLLANPISWVTTIIVIPSRARAVITSRTSRMYSGSKADVGSSNSMALGSMASALAIATRCCWPPDSSAG